MNRLLTILLAVMILLSVNLSTAEEASGVKAGDIITFGRYPQTEEGMDQTPIEWIVLEVKDGKALVISCLGLDAVQYNDERTKVTWETCSLRAWLNRDFLNAAFSLPERDAIPMTEVDNSSAQGYSEWEWNTDGGNNTLDQVFLLSCAEANRYLGWEEILNIISAQGLSQQLMLSVKGLLRQKLVRRRMAQLQGGGGFGHRDALSTLRHV